MEADDSEGCMRVILKLVPGRDDLAIAMLEAVKPRYRADRVRTVLYMHAAGQSGAPIKDQDGKWAGTPAPVAHASPAKADAGRSSGAIGAQEVHQPTGSAAVDDEYDFSQLNGVAMQVDFTGASGGQR